MKKRYLILFIFPIHLSLGVFAQEIGRKEIILKSIKKNNELKLKKNEIELTKLDQQKAKLTYVPKIGVDAAYFYSGNDFTLERDFSYLNNGETSGLLNPDAIKQSFEQGYSNGFGQTWQEYLTQNPQLVQQLGGIENAMLFGEGVATSVGQGMSSGLESALSPFMGMGSELALPLLAGQESAWFYDIHADMVIFSGLKVPNLAKAAHHKMLAQQAMYVKEEQELVIEVMSYYDRLSVLDQSLIVLKNARERLKKQTEYAEKAKNNGLATSYDLNKIKIAEQEIKSKEIELSAGIDLLISKLHQLSGISKEELRQIHPELNVWNITVDEMNMESRPEVIALNESILAMEYKHKSEEFDFLPKAKAFAHYTQGGSDYAEMSPFWFVGVGVKWELFDGMQRKKDIQKSSLEVESMKIKKEDAQELVQLEYEKMLMEWKVASQLVEVENEKLNHAFDAMVIKEKEFKNGMVSINDRLEADGEYQKAQLDYIQSIYRQRQTTLYLLKASSILDVEIVD